MMYFRFAILPVFLSFLGSLFITSQSICKNIILRLQFYQLQSFLSFATDNLFSLIWYVKNFYHCFREGAKTRRISRTILLTPATMEKLKPMVEGAIEPPENKFQVCNPTCCPTLGCFILVVCCAFCYLFAFHLFYKMLSLQQLLEIVYQNVLLLCVYILHIWKYLSLAILLLMKLWWSGLYSYPNLLSS